MRSVQLPVVAALVMSVVLSPDVIGQDTVQVDVAAFWDSVGATLDTVRTAQWYQTSWERLGRKEETTSGACTWAGQSNMRLDVDGGRGKGATAILYENRVHGFRRGILSFAKRSFEIDHPKVLSLRGRTMAENGFMDDLSYAYTHRHKGIVSFTSDGPLLEFTDASGLKNHMLFSIRMDFPRRHEVYEQGELVEVYTYRDVRYNARIDFERMRR